MTAIRMQHILTFHFRTKDEDVTWLYGPLYTARSWQSTESTHPDPTDSIISLKPSLKTPCLEKILMHRSVSDLALIRPSLSSTNSSQSFSRSSSPITEISTPSIPDVAPTRRKTVSFHDQVSQCIAVGTEESSEDSLAWPRSSLYVALRPSAVTSSPQPQESTVLTKIIEIIAPTTLKPEALPHHQKVVAERKSWPGRTLSYFWDNDIVPEIPEPKVTTPYFPPPVETKSYFDMDDDDDEDDEMSWNPPRPRKLSGNSIDIAPLPQECKYITSLSSYPHAPPPRRITSALLNDEETFEAEMFGSSHSIDKVELPAEDTSDTQSARSSPAIPEYMVSSNEELKDNLRDRQNSDSSWSSEESKSAASSTIYSQAAQSLNLGLGLLGATASAGINDLYNKFEQASSTVVSTVKKERSSFASSCSSEFNAVYRTNHNFAVQRPAPVNVARTDDEEHWWMNV